MFTGTFVGIIDSLIYFYFVSAIGFEIFFYALQMYFPLKLWMTQVYTSFIHATDSHGSCKACLLIYSAVISIHWSIFISSSAVSSIHAAALDHLPATWTGEETRRQPLCSAHSLGPQLQLRSYSTSGVHDDVIKWKHFPRYWPFVRGIGEFPAQRLVTRSFDVFFDLRLNKRSSKQWRGWWLETSSCPLWCHCNVLWRYCHNLT